MAVNGYILFDYDYFVNNFSLQVNKYIKIKTYSNVYLIFQPPSMRKSTPLI